MDTLGSVPQTIYHVRKKYHAHKGNTILDLLQEKPRSGQPVKVDSRMAAHVAMIACSEAPAGATHWTLQLIADRLSTQNGRFHLYRECTKGVKKNKLKPWLNKRWCIGKITSEYLWHMEDILYQYARPYDPLSPLLCYDERPCQLLGDLLVPLRCNRVSPSVLIMNMNGMGPAVCC